jgi:hypothetical protein
MSDDDPYDYLDDEDDEPDNFGFECPAFWVGDESTGGWYCPMQGSEDCDWDCPGPPDPLGDGP